MKKYLRYTLYFFVFFFLAVASLLIYLKTALPDVGPAPDIKIAYTPERIAHGRYLALAVTVCVDCHSKRDWAKFSGPLVEGSLGMGGQRFDQKVGLPGVYYSRNITPEGISRYSDGELFRLITTGVDKEGRALFPVMPFSYYGRMDPEDIYDIISYVRSLDPIKNDVPEHVSDFPMNFIINTLPQKAEPQKRPDTTDVLAYGAYTINATACKECHTQVNKGQVIPELAFAGGREFQMPDGSVVRSANLTQDMGTGIGKMTEEVFIQRFKEYADSSYTSPVISSGEFNSIMPWSMYARMKRSDLAAIYAYLKTVKPIANAVVKFTPPEKK
jgi:mono/diheme cytochrome c family protein